MPNLPIFSAKLIKIVVAKWSPILVLAWAWLLNFSNLTIHPHCPLCSLMLVLCITEAFNWGILFSLCEKVKVPCSPILVMASTCKDDTKVKVVHVNGQINEVKQLEPRRILRWVTIWHPQFYFQFGRNIRQIRQICQLNRNSKIPRMEEGWTLLYMVSCAKFQCVGLKLSEVYLQHM